MTEKSITITNNEKSVTLPLTEDKCVLVLKKEQIVIITKTLLAYEKSLEPNRGITDIDNWCRQVSAARHVLTDALLK